MVEMLDHRARDRAAFLADDWRKALEQERGRSPESGNPIGRLVAQVLSALGEARSPFSELSSAIKPHGNRFECPDPGAGKQQRYPQGVRQALELRDAFMSAAVVRALRASAEMSAPGEASADSSWKTLLNHLESLASRADRPALRPAGPGVEVESGFVWANYAASDNAQRFFTGTLSGMIGRMDRQLGTRLSTLTHRPYSAGDDGSIDHWSRLWTSAVAIVAADWIRVKGCKQKDPSLDYMADTLWRGIKNDQGEPLKLYPGNAVLPMGAKVAPGLQVSLALPTMPAQVIEYLDERWVDDESGLRRPIRIRIHELNSEWRDGERRYRALNGGQLYLAILATCLDGPASPRSLSASEGPAGDGLPPQLSAEQTRCLEAIDQRRRASSARENRAGMRRAGTERFEASIAMSASESGSIWDGGLEFQAAAPENAESPDAEVVLGAIDLWSHLPESFGWIDVLFIAERTTSGDRWILPIELEEGSQSDSFDADASADATPRHALLLTDSASARASPAELQRALASPGRTHWHYEYAGLGVFVVALVKL
jgi:hypothetical protein